MANVKHTNLDPQLPTNSSVSRLTASLGSKINVNKSLEQHYTYIMELARTHLPRNVVPPKEFSEEISDLAQITLITFWLRLISDKRPLTSPKAYIGCIVRSRCVDIVRRRKGKSTLPLPVDQDGELYQGRVMLIPGAGMQDPAIEYERKELITEVVDDVLKLPPHQQYAMICVLKDEVGDTFPLVETFRKHGVDIAIVDWPHKAAELQKLQSSLSVARRKLRTAKSKYGIV